MSKTKSQIRKISSSESRHECGLETNL